MYAKWSIVTKPQKVSVGKLKSKVKGRVVVKLTGVSKGADGYEFVLATNAKFTKNKKKKISKKSVFTISGLSSKKKYYIYVRPYKLDSENKKVYGKASKIKKIKVK